MRWKGKYKNLQKVKFKRFAIIPKKMTDTGEWVWLEFYQKEMTYYNGHMIFGKQYAINKDAN